MLPNKKSWDGGVLLVIRKISTIAAFCAAGLGPAAAGANELVTTLTNNLGTPGGLIDMPTAEMAPDAELTATVSHFDGFTKSTLSFQITPWLSGSFRYSGTRDLSKAFGVFYDRSFDIRARIVQETEYLPAIAVGLQDFVGTGVLSGEYIVATKSIGDRLRVTGGVGWGRLGSYNSFGSHGSRMPFRFQAVGNGGNIDAEEWFQGDMAAFGGMTYQFTDKLSFSAEYSSDAYDFEKRQGIFTRSTPWNFAADYKATNGLNLRLFALHGEEFGVAVTLLTNPLKAPVNGGLENAPLPVGVRPAGSAADLGWSLEPSNRQAVASRVYQTVEKEDVHVDGIDVRGRSAHVLIRNERYNAEAQALGRTLRTLSRTLPPSVETLHVTITRMGVPMSTVTFSRTDLERLENAPASEALARAQFTDSLRFGNLPEPMPGTYPRFDWSTGPFLRTQTFDPDNPIRADVRFGGKANAHLGSGWVLSGAASVKVFGNLDENRRKSDSVIPRVRSRAFRYNDEEHPTIDQLTLSNFGRLGPDLYSRITVGYLEQMYAGASGEVLWKPVDSRLAFGAEVNYVMPRDFDQLLDTRTRRTAGGMIPEWNGHLSAYYEFENGFDARVHAGRYLAGDWGATLEVNRTFANGWVIGAFATKTDISADQFGEGSFDKGIRITMPMSWLLSTPTQRAVNTTIRPLTRDGGQRVEVSNRLYETVRGAHKPDVAESWGKFWR